MHHRASFIRHSPGAQSHINIDFFNLSPTSRLQLNEPGIHTGGRETKDFPQHKYYSKVVLKYKQQQSDNCCSKKVSYCSKFFSKGVF